MALLVLVIMFGLAVFLLYRSRPYLAWVSPVIVGLLYWMSTGKLPFLLVLVSAIFVVAAVLFGLPPLRRTLITRTIMNRMTDILPRLSETERLALEAGTVWWDGELFSGDPDWNKLAEFQIKQLTPEERAFLNGPTEELCSMIDTVQAAQDGDLSPAVWDFMREHRFFGMIIPKEHGGLGFSAMAHSAVVAKVASRSTAASVTVMVPNSLGPAELLLHYGTKEQKDYYLPRLARGEEIPTFALTEPEAGSDAASARSSGVVCRGTFEGKEVTGIRLNWNKRYATLAPAATVIGLAFQLHDPERLLGGAKTPGITCALIPVNLPGVETGRRHDPLGVPFLNGPTTGKDVFVPVDFIIGGPAMAGQGWRMLMESLASGRSISLPALSVGAVEMATRVSGAYATIREQFNVPIGRFEGIEERLGRVAGFAYLMNATRRLTVGAVDSGEKPSVISAVVKAYLTELMRVAVNDAMDISAGAGISRGPRNTLAVAYSSLPIGITVEGANILTRCLIIFGQGAIRCHPWVLEEIHAVGDHDLARFDHALFKHVGFAFSNAVRAPLLALSQGRLGRPALGGAMQPYLGQFTRMSAAFTLLSDVAMATLGGDLKRKEMLSGRMADALAWMYLGSATVKRFVDEGHPEEDAMFARWGCEHALFQIQTALLGVLENFPVPWVRALKPVLFPWGATIRPPSDRLTQRVARELVGGRKGRLRLTEDIYVPQAHEPGLGQLEDTLIKVVATYPLQKRLKAAIRDRRVKRGPRKEMIAQAREIGILNDEEFSMMEAAEDARENAIQVDAFPADYFGFGEGKEEPARAQA